MSEAAPKPPVVPNPRPKAQFMALGGLVARHRDLMQTPELQEAINYALLEYQLSLCRPENDPVAGACHFKLCGANEFVKLLKTLAETPKEPDRQKATGLNHQI